MIQFDSDKCFRKFELSSKIDDPIEKGGLGEDVTNILVWPRGYFSMIFFIVGTLLIFIVENRLSTLYLKILPTDSNQINDNVDNYKVDLDKKEEMKIESEKEFDSKFIQISPKRKSQDESQLNFVIKDDAEINTVGNIDNDKNIITTYSLSNLSMKDDIGNLDIDRNLKSDSEFNNVKNEENLKTDKNLSLTDIEINKVETTNTE